MTRAARSFTNESTRATGAQRRGADSLPGSASARVGQGARVKFSVPTLHGVGVLAGTVKRVLADGRVEVKAQNGGYYVRWPAELVDA